MRSANPSSTRLTVNEPMSRICADVSFGEPSGRDCNPRTMSGGASANTLKNENGAALTMPPGPSVVTSAIGRGTTSAHRSL
jgi:hypothetical protein